MQIFAAGLPREGASNNSGVVNDVNFQDFWWLFLQKLIDKVGIILGSASNK